MEEYGATKKGTVKLTEKHLTTVRQALFDAVHDERGTGKSARSELVEVSGKTGTAQVVEMRGRIIKSKDLPYTVRDHAWFVAYAPARDPEIAVATLVEHGGHGGSAAAPMTKEIIERYFRLADREVALPGATPMRPILEAHAN